MSTTQELNRLLKVCFLPYVEERGFILGKSPNPQFSVFRRHYRDKIQVFDIQWDKYWRPRFVVNFGEGPQDGVRLWGNDIAGEALWPHDCPESGRLQRQRGPSLRSWFRLEKPLLEAVLTMDRRYSPEIVVEQLLATFPEVESWWESRTVGPHLSITPTDAWQIASAKEAAG